MFYYVPLNHSIKKAWHCIDLPETSARVFQTSNQIWEGVNLIDLLYLKHLASPQFYASDAYCNGMDLRAL